MIFAVCMMTWMVSHRYFRLKGMIFVSYKKARSTKNKTKKQQHHERATTRSSYLYDFIRCFYLAAAKNAEMLKQRKDQATKQRHTVIYNTLYLGYQISFCFAWLLYLFMLYNRRILSTHVPRLWYEGGSQHDYM